MPECWLAQFSSVPCEGPLERAHIITKQRLRLFWNDLHHGPEMRPGGKHWLDGTGVLPATLKLLQEDERTWRPACRRHHGMMDHGRRPLRVPREAVPGDVEAFCEALGLAWWLDITYGHREAA